MGFLLGRDFFDGISRLRIKKKDVLRGCLG